MADATKLAPNTCPQCAGFGYTKDTSPELRKDNKGLYTYRQGSGCAACHGTGRTNG